MASLAQLELDTPSSESIAKLESLIGDIRVAMMTTVAADGSLHTRPMATQAKPTIADLWFLTSVSFAMTEEIETVHVVSLSYAEPKKETYIAISGTARIVKDEAKARELWTPWAKIWFPEGPTDPTLRLVCVAPERAEYWDSKSSRMVMLYQAVKAAVGATPSVPQTDHRKLNLAR